MALKVFNTQYNTRTQKPYSTPIESQYLNNVINAHYEFERNEEELIISRVNAILCVFISVLIAVMLVSYYVVTVKEIQLNKIHKNIILNRDENVEMQNKLDSLTSYTHVDKMSKKKNLVQTSKQIIEVDASNETVDKKIKNTRKPSFKWSIGY